MSLLPDRTYHILPKDSSLDGDALGIGPVPLIYPPPDVPVRLIGVSLRVIVDYHVDIISYTHKGALVAETQR